MAFTGSCGSTLLHWARAPNSSPVLAVSWACWVSRSVRLPMEAGIWDCTTPTAFLAVFWWLLFQKKA